MQEDFDITRSVKDAGYFFDRNRDIMGAVALYETLIETERNQSICRIYRERIKELLIKIEKE